MNGVGSVIDLHNNNTNAISMWHTDANPGVNAWVQFDLGQVCDVGEMWIWNINQANNSARGFRDVKIEYKLEENDPWIELRGEGSQSGKTYPYAFARASGLPDQAATNLAGTEIGDENCNLPVIFNKELRYVRLTADPVIGQGSYGSEYFGLSEIRFTLQEEQEELDVPAKVTLSSNGGALTSLSDALGETVDADVVLKGDSTNEEFLIIAALYDASGRLVGVKSTEVQVADGEKETFRLSMDIPASAVGYTYKLFVWNAAFAPLIGATELK